MRSGLGNQVLAIHPGNPGNLVLDLRDFEEDAIDAAALKNRLSGLNSTIFAQDHIHFCHSKKTQFCCQGNANKIADALHIFEVVGAETSFEKMMQVSLRKMQSQSESMIKQLIEEEFE